MDGAAGQAANRATWADTGFWRALTGLLARIRVQKKLRALRIEETLALGDRRFVAVVRWENQRLLLGVTPQAITLLEPNTKKDAHRAPWEGDPGK
jgi:flagellar biogenesis protein FliO